MEKLSRRKFLVRAASGLGALAIEPLLNACGRAASMNPAPTVAAPAGAATLPAAAPATLSPTGEPTLAASDTPAPSPTPAPLPELVVARNGDPQEMVRRALAALGGIERFVKPGAKVVVKPNICVAYHTYEYAATTNPWVVAALVSLCLGAGAASVKVLDYPFGGTQQEAYQKSGIAEQVKAAGGEMVSMPAYQYVDVAIPNGQSLKTTKAFKDVLDADTLIDVPIAKTHSLARLTLGMKNLMGVIVDRTAIHHDLGQRLADLTSLFHPALTVIDAVRVLVANGPTGGNLSDVKQMNTIIASADIVAADSYATGLFGMQPDDLPSIPAAVAMGLGRSDLASLRIEEIAVGG